MTKIIYDYHWWMKYILCPPTSILSAWKSRNTSSKSENDQKWKPTNVVYGHRQLIGYEMNSSMHHTTRTQYLQNPRWPSGIWEFRQANFYLCQVPCRTWKIEEYKMSKYLSPFFIFQEPPIFQLHLSSARFDTVSLRPSAWPPTLFSLTSLPRTHKVFLYGTFGVCHRTVFVQIFFCFRCAPVCYHWSRMYWFMTTYFFLIWRNTL